MKFTPNWAGLIEQRQYKACPVVIRETEQGTEVLVFRHPLAGIQLVKGTVEPGEHVQDTALRELEEEAGISSAKILQDLAIWPADYEQQVWNFLLCETQTLPERWNHMASDDGGHRFEFFWHPLCEQPDNNWHDVYVRALQTIQQRLKEAGLKMENSE